MNPVLSADRRRLGTRVGPGQIALGCGHDRVRMQNARGDSVTAGVKRIVRTQAASETTVAVAPPPLPSLPKLVTEGSLHSLVTPLLSVVRTR